MEFSRTKHIIIIGFNRIEHSSIDRIWPMGRIKGHGVSHIEHSSIDISKITHINIGSTRPMESRGQGGSDAHTDIGAMGICRCIIKQQLR